MSAMKRSDVQRNLRRGVYVIPTSLTVLNLFFGFRCMVNSTRALQAITEGHTDLAETFFTKASIALLIAAIFDTFDGLIARQLGATSEFGKEYDSLADVVTFGAAPAVLVYAWGLNVLGNLGGGIAFLFLVAVLRTSHPALAVRAPRKLSKFAMFPPLTSNPPPCGYPMNSAIHLTVCPSISVAIGDSVHPPQF